MLFKPESIHTDFLSLGEPFYSKVTPTPLNNPRWIHINSAVADLLGISVDDIREQGLPLLSGQTILSDHPGIAMVYSGHQFGGYSPQLGDGRALLLAQYQSLEGLIDIQLKGAGKTLLPLHRQIRISKATGGLCDRAFFADCIERQQPLSTII